MTALLRSITRHYPLLTPRAAILRRLPPVPADAGPFRGRHGLIAGYYAGREHVSASLYWLGDFDPWVDRTLRTLAAPGATVLDIGANIGATSLVLARAVGAAGRVHAFEPQPANAARFAANVAANDLRNVTLHGVALSDREGTMSLGIPGEQPAMARVAAVDDAAATRVPMTTLDAWLAGRPEIGSIGVCKIDVEGHEAGVFAGMFNAIAAGRIDAFCFERHVVGDAGADPLLTQVAGYGYAVYRIGKSATRVRYARLGEPLAGVATEDFVAVRRNADTHAARAMARAMARDAAR